MLIDAESCCLGERLKKLFDTPKTVREVLTLRDGPWENVKAEDRIWVVTRSGALPYQVIADWAVRITLWNFNRRQVTDRDQLKLEMKVGYTSFGYKIAYDVAAYLNTEDQEKFFKLAIEWLLEECPV